MKNYRSRQVGELIKRELALLINKYRDLEYSEFFFTVTEVRPTRDLRYADIWVSVYGNSEKRKAAIEKLKRDLRKLRQDVAQKIHLRRIPEFRLKLDETLDNAERIDKKLNSMTMKDKTENSDE